MRLVFLGLAALSYFSLQAQSYVFSYGESTYEELESPTEIPVNEFFGKAAMPFSFEYFGQTVDTVYISLNGALDVDGGWLHGIEGDLENHLSLQTRLSYKVEGISPYRILKMEWKNLGTRSDSAAFDSVNFQIWFMEHSHAIEMHFGPSYISQSAIDKGVFLSKSGPNIGIFDFNMNHHALEGDAANPQLVRSTTMKHLNDVPQNGMVYRFTALKASAPRFTQGFGGMQYVADQSYLINWSTPMENVSLEYSLDGTQSWNAIAVDLNDSFYNWTAPKQSSSALYFRLRDELGNVVAQSEYANRLLSLPATDIAPFSELSVSAYPNPTSGNLLLHVNDVSQHGSVCVLNQLGQEIGRFNLENGQVMIPSEKFKNGMYHALVLIGDNLVQSLRFVKN
ncbi:MAG: T9SS type A sorting domain-containing protein [Bacteroidetes bacterium]|nr:MAG: T9SS type A sorting domain-containing protein [Bacteroidota bacterium]